MSCVSLNDLICGRQQRFRDGEAERLGGLEVEDQFDVRVLLDRKIAGLLAPEYTSGIAPDQPIAIHRVAGVAQDAAGRHKFPVLKNLRDAVSERKLAEPCAPAEKKWIGGDHEACSAHRV